MIRKQIRPFDSGGKSQTRLCDVVIDGNKVYLEWKTGRNTFCRIPWDDVVEQVRSLTEEKQKTHDEDR